MPLRTSIMPGQWNAMNLDLSQKHEVLTEPANAYSKSTSTSVSYGQLPPLHKCCRQRNCNCDCLKGICAKKENWLPSSSQEVQTSHNPVPLSARKICTIPLAQMQCFLINLQKFKFKSGHILVWKCSHSFLHNQIWGYFFLRSLGNCCFVDRRLPSSGDVTDAPTLTEWQVLWFRHHWQGHLAEISPTVQTVRTVLGLPSQKLRNLGHVLSGANSTSLNCD